jgi:hypothetical protein
MKLIFVGEKALFTEFSSEIESKNNFRLHHSGSCVLVNIANEYYKTGVTYALRCKEELYFPSNR